MSRSAGNSAGHVNTNTTQKLPETFGGLAGRHTVAVLDFQVRASDNRTNLGKTIAERVRSRLSSKWFQLMERSQIAGILEEHDLQASGLVSNDMGRKVGQLADVSYLVLGSVTMGENVVVDARVVDVSTGEILRQGSATGASLTMMAPDLDALAIVLSTSDSVYQVYQERKQAAGRKAASESLRQYPIVKREGDDLVVEIRVALRNKRETTVYAEARQKLRELYAAYCKDELGLRLPKSELMDDCRKNAECEDVSTSGGFKKMTFRVPLPHN